MTAKDDEYFKDGYNNRNRWQRYYRHDYMDEKWKNDLLVEYDWPGNYDLEGVDEYARPVHPESNLPENDPNYDDSVWTRRPPREYLPPEE